MLLDPAPSSAGTTDHAALSHLEYASSGHTGFAPAVHAHAQGDITGLVAALAGKSAIGHTHAIGEIVTGATSDGSGNVVLGGTLGVAGGGTFGGTLEGGTVTAGSGRQVVNFGGDNYLKGVTYWRTAGGNVVKASIDGETGQLSAVTARLGTATDNFLFTGRNPQFWGWLSSEGSYPLSMTGDGRVLINIGDNADDDGTSALQVGGNARVTGDITARGNTLVGQLSGGLAGYAGFAHSSVAAAGSYALIQSNDGQTYLNAASGTTLHLRVANSERVAIDGTSTTVTGPLAVTGAVTAGDDITLPGNKALRSTGVLYVTADAGQVAFYKPAINTQILIFGSAAYPNAVSLTHNNSEGILSTLSGGLKLSPDSGVTSVIGALSATGPVKSGTLDTTTVPGTVVGQTCVRASDGKNCEWDGADWQPLR